MILRIGHRGAAGYEPENTLLSFNKALELEVDMIELDAQVCKTGEIVVIHDAKIDRTTNGTGFVADKTFRELRSLDAGKGQLIPTLQEVLEAVNRKARVNIEIKGEGAAGAVFDIIRAYVGRKGWSWEDFLVSSFNHYELLEFSRLAPEVRIGAVIACIPVGYAECAAKVNAYSLHPSKEFINQVLIDDAHKRGMKVFAYTPNDSEFIQKIKSLGVDGIFSDFPDRIQENRFQR
ncbi:MAG: glycerophosphodiester phosphodiesterase family protein [Candidatus Omnitrophota bacterium]